MSQSSFPFEGTGAPAPEDDAAGGSHTKVALGGLLAAAVLAAGGFVLLGSGGAPPPEPVTVPARKAPAAAAAPAPIEVVPASATEVIGRNPFKPRYVEPATASAGTTTNGTPAGTGTGATSGATGGTTGGTGSAPGLPTGAGSTGTTPKPGGSTGTTPKPGGSTAPAPAPQPKEAPKYISVVAVDAANNQVTFKSVDRTTAKPEAREQVHVVKPGETFATYFKLFGYGSLVDASGQPRDCTDLLYGDARLKLCVGESYQVS